MSIPNRKFKPGDEATLSTGGRSLEAVEVLRPEGYYEGRGHTYSVARKKDGKKLDVAESQLTLVRRDPKKNDRRKAQTSKQQQWTVVFLNREGQPIQFERIGKIVDFFHEKNYESTLVNELEDAMKEVGMEFGAPAGTYVIGLWEGKIPATSGRVSTRDLEKIKPRFYVYEGGQTHVVT